MKEKENYIHPGKKDTLEKAVFTARALANALSQVIGDKELVVNIDGDIYVVHADFDTNQIKISTAKEVSTH